MLAPERREKILSVIMRNKSALVKDLCVMFNVTGETIRKDLSILQMEGKVLKTYGGAYIREGVKNQVHVNLREGILPQAKHNIGKICAQMVQDGDTIFLDESTTCLSIAKQLHHLVELTVITNSLKIISLFEDTPKVRLIALGGELDTKTQSFVGSDTLAMLENYYVDKGFVSCRGLDCKAGITDGQQGNGEIRRKMLEHSNRRILVADQSKLNLVNFYKICGFDAIHTVVIDQLQGQEWHEFLKKQNIEVREADTP